MIEDKEVNVTDVIEIAIRLERFGLKFFNAVSELDISEDVKELFNFLASEEEKHVGTYCTMLNNVSGYHSQYNYPGDYGKYLDTYSKIVFMKIITSSRFSDSIKNAVSNIDYKSKDFFDKLAELQDIKTAGDALNIAREIEISAIVFYSETIPLFKEKDQFIIKLIIKEEKEHLKKINNMLKLMAKYITV
jgi:rubrerythrin